MVNIKAKASALLDIVPPAAQELLVGTLRLSGLLLQRLQEMLQSFIRNIPDAWVSSANRDEAFDQGLQIPRLLAPEVRRFFLHFDGRVVRPESAVDEGAAFDGDVGEVGWRSRGCANL